MVRLGLFGFAVLVSAEALSRRDPEGRTVIHAPNLASDGEKSAKAINKYFDASKQNLESWDIAKQARTVAPGMYPKRLEELLKSQEDTMEVLDKAHTAATTAKDTQISQHDELKTEMASREAKLGKGRVADDFEAEAAELKTTMR